MTELSLFAFGAITVSERKLFAYFPFGKRFILSNNWEYEGLCVSLKVTISLIIKNMASWYLFLMIY